MKVGMTLGEEPNSTTSTTSSISYSNSNPHQQCKEGEIKKICESKEDSSEASLWSSSSWLNHQTMLRIPSRGTLIIDGELSESKELTIDTVDIETFNEMYSHLKRRNRIYHISFILLLLTNALFIYQLYTSKETEKDLHLKIEKIVNEKKKLMEQISLKRQEGEKQQCFLCGSTNDHSTPLFEISNCYMSIQTTASLGQCSKDLQSSIENWYQGYYAWWENYFGSPAGARSGDNMNGEERSTLPKAEKEIFDEKIISIDDLINFI